MMRGEWATPALIVNGLAFAANVTAMSRALPGAKLRPHVKAFKSTALAKQLAAAGHQSFTCATLAEMAGMIRAGLGHDLLLANETVNVNALSAVATLAAEHNARVTIAVDSPATVEAAAAAGIAEVLVDVNVGLPRCGASPERAPQVADLARDSGMTVRGVMGYEGHLMMVEPAGDRRDKVKASMEILAVAAAAIGGDVISAGGTGTYNIHAELGIATEVQAGSYTLMDTDYGQLGHPFVPALEVESTIISVTAAPANGTGWLVADAGLKAFGMDHGNPSWNHGDVWFCSDEHITLAPHEPDRWSVGDRIRLRPAHVDPTVAKHDEMIVERPDQTHEIWPVDLRGWTIQ